MAFLQTQFFSDALAVAVTVNVILPEPKMGIGITASEGEQEDPAVLYLLHGYSDDHSIWMRRTSIERYAASHNLAVIMPAVNHSFYTNEKVGERYWDFVAEELPAAMHRFFRLSKDPARTYVAGLSMGGYGSFKLALTFPERFAAAASFSGCVNIADMTHRKGSNDNMIRIFGDLDKLAGSDNDLFHLLEKNAKAPHRPKLYVSCGTADFLYHQHQAFLPQAAKFGWTVEHYEKPDATHEWGFWDEQVKVFINKYID